MPGFGGSTDRKFSVEDYQPETINPLAVDKVLGARFETRTFDMGKLSSTMNRNRFLAQGIRIAFDAVTPEN
jgi:hypothetical protein